MRIINGFEENLRDIGEAVKNGGIVAFPTDTVYGLGASIYQEEAIKRVFRVKKRPLNSAIIVLISDKAILEKIAYVNDEKIWILIDKFWPGALTIILPKREGISDIITGGGNNIGVRIPDNDIARQIIRESGGALATPSANKTGQLSPTMAGHVLKQFSDNEIDYLIDGGKTKNAIESTILDMTCNPPKILRNGGVSKEQIFSIIGNVDEVKIKKKSENKFSKHIEIIKREDFFKLSKESVLLAFTNVGKLGIKKVEVLSEKGEYEEASRNLFEALHNLLEEDNETIYVEEIQEIGFGKLIMERIKKIVK